LLGEPLVPPEIPEEVRERLEANLDEAWEAFDADPLDEERIIWLGRRLGYLGRYNESVEVYSAGLEAHPESFKLLRHRGHRFVTLRRLNDAVADLGRAAELIDDIPDQVEPDGAPNAANIPRSTSHSNIWYHLGLAYYLTGDFDRAVDAYRKGMTFSSVNDDMLCATSYWLYLSLRKLGRDQEARAVLLPIRPDMEILESFAYHRLLILFKGRGSGEQTLAEARQDGIELATTGYGVGAWLRLEGDPARARALFREIVDTTPWAAFGHIAAEAELRGMGDD